MPYSGQVNQNGHDPSSGRPRSSLGRSLSDLRLHTHPTVGGMENDARRLISDADIDPALQSRNPSVDGLQSLPSLKASGLLDSWNSGKDCSPKQGSPTWTPRSEGQQKRPSPPSMKSPPGYAPVGQTPDSDSGRSSTSGAPVGLPWLANESR
jgi:hypothetical protein